MIQLETKTIEQLILENLCSNEQYCRRVLPFIKEEYFHNSVEKNIVRHIIHHVTEYNKLPNKDSLSVGLSNDKKLSQKDYDDCVKYIKELSEIPNDNEDWLLDETEKFCKDKSIYNAVLESIHIIDGKSTTRTVDALPTILSEALSVSFDTNIGHDYLKDAEKRYDFYHKSEQKIPFDLEYFNSITNGGVPQKTLNCIIAGTGVGKSLFLCHHAANCLMQNKNVLYITCEMAEERIAERIDANIMDMTIDDMKKLPKSMYAKKLFQSTQGVTGRLIIKEYPTASAHVNHFRHLLHELKLKLKFVPDVIFIDYLNICTSSRFKSSAVNSYTYIKGIAEEIRGLAVEFNLPIFTATQTNRQGFNNSDMGLENTSESFGLPATVDFMFALISTEELEKKNHFLVKQLKNRYNDLASNRKFLVGVNRGKMKLFDVEESEQNGLLGTGEEDDIGLEGLTRFDTKFSKRKDFV
jgi:replicative DNA helicase